MVWGTGVGRRAGSWYGVGNASLCLAYSGSQPLNPAALVHPASTPPSFPPLPAPAPSAGRAPASQLAHLHPHIAAAKLPSTIKSAANQRRRSLAPGSALSAFSLRSLQARGWQQATRRRAGGCRWGCWRCATRWWHAPCAQLPAGVPPHCTQCSRLHLVVEDQLGIT